MTIIRELNKIDGWIRNCKKLAAELNSTEE